MVVIVDLFTTAVVLVVFSCLVCEMCFVFGAWCVTVFATCKTYVGGWYQAVANFASQDFYTHLCCQRQSQIIACQGSMR